MNLQNPNTLPPSMKGFTLVEILIAVLVLSIGLLGLAGLQTLSLRSNYSAYLRSQATFLTYDLIDRMRINPIEAASGRYLTAFGSAPGSSTNCESGVCTTSDMVAYDMTQWKCMLGNWSSTGPCTSLSITGLLPKGDGEITQVGNIITVAVRYEERDGNTVTLQISSRI